MKRMLMLLPLALLTLGVAAQAEVIQKQTTTTTVVIPNACTLENVEFALTEHFTYQVTSNGNTAHVAMHVNMAGTGAGETSGANYTINGTEQMDFQIAVGMGISYVQHANVIGRGNVPNFKVHATIHVTVDANGNVTALVTNFTGTCE
jgi:opacity protein-like surface antigen